MNAIRPSKDRLFLIRPDFKDPAFPDQRFYCWHCALIEGVLTAFPALAERLDIERVPWNRPREAVIAYVGEANQTLPLLILADGANSRFSTGSFNGLNFIADKDGILAAFTERYGFPEAHP